MDGFLLLALAGVALFLILGSTSTAPATVSGNGYGAAGDYVPSLGGSYYSGEGDVIGGDQDTLARTIYGEARGESYAAQQGVASVVMNRAADTLHFPDGAISVAAICKQPWQFSCWNANDPNRSVIENVQAGNQIFDQCLAIAARALGGTLPDNTGGAEYYHDTSIATPQSWGQVVRTTQIGRLVFFRSVA